MPKDRMGKALLVALLLFCVCFESNAATVLPNRDTVFGILKIGDSFQRDKKLTTYIRIVFQQGSIADLDDSKARFDKIFADARFEKKVLFGYYVKVLYCARLLRIKETESFALKGIDLAGKNDDHFMLYSFFSQLAFTQTYAGNTIEAISSFREAKRQALLMDDSYYLAVVDINISDIYFRNNFYSQSIFYLNRVAAIVQTQMAKERQIVRQNLLNLVYDNKAENYFRMNNIDSLAKYNGLLKKFNEAGVNDNYIKRTDYFLSLLRRQYPEAVAAILKLQKDNPYPFDNSDKQNLAEAYFRIGQTDSAKAISTALLNDPALNNHPELKFQVYKLLGDIAFSKKDFKEAADNQNKTIEQLEDHLNRLAQVGNISSQIKVDELEDSYLQKEELYRRERLWLWFFIVIVVLAFVIIALLYWNTRQRRFYERLLLSAKREELSFINSHEVRRHLSNILGIVQTIRDSDDRVKEYAQLQEYLFSSAKELDNAIMNISEKLDQLYKDK